MEEIWKKFKNETKEHMEKINEFLNGNTNDELLEKPVETLNEKSPDDDDTLAWREASEQIQQIVLEKPNENSKPSRKETYGKMRNLVKEIMEKENLSRAQAYRKAKKILENSHS